MHHQSWAIELLVTAIRTCVLLNASSIMDYWVISHGDQDLCFAKCIINHVLLSYELLQSSCKITTKNFQKIQKMRATEKLPDPAGNREPGQHDLADMKSWSHHCRWVLYPCQSQRVHFFALHTIRGLQNSVFSGLLQSTWLERHYSPLAPWVCLRNIC